MTDRTQQVEQLDVVIVGAGISGIGAGYELQRSHPDKTFAIVDMRDDIGGTWDLFRYPGIRSDSDMYTLGYSFEPWTQSKALAPAATIKEYLRAPLHRAGLDRRLRLGHRLTSASFDTTTDRWTLALQTAEGCRVIECSFLYLGSGYYSYSGGYNPELPGEDQFSGMILHPQEWPEDLDYAGRRVAVIGSGATAVTLVPSLAESAEHVVMVQRSPTYVVNEVSVDEEADRLREEVGPAEAFTRIRLRNIQAQQDRYREARENPEAYKKEIFDAIDEMVGEDIRAQHFTPAYQPWDQRVCAVPDGDLFKAIRAGRAEVVTGTISTLNEHGIVMADGTVVEADIIVKATGLNIMPGGEARYTVDGVEVDFSSTFTYKGLAYSGVPNLFFAFGFLNSSWTLRLELVNEFWSRVLKHMDATGATRVTPTLADGEESMQRRPFIADVNSSYFVRSLSRFPSQGTPPWTNPQDYRLTQEMLADDPDDGWLRFTG
ncbi:flavin-containing monooxygenase [Nocardioides sambongensis]|uniref:flavin-containing monooxygenase n=1 Tax=Nocardioides sambongensis TaxID=2589074 RepID=UPI00112B835F|nr:NAD(P)/FAD-dependent oxidoreductase [Nocardioides sambongensis]